MQSQQTDTIADERHGRHRRRRTLLGVCIILSISATLVSLESWWWVSLTCALMFSALRIYQNARWSNGLNAYFWDQLGVIDQYSYVGVSAPKPDDGAVVIQAPVIVSRAQKVSSSYGTIWKVEGGYTVHVHNIRVERDVNPRPRGAWSSSMTSYAVEYVVAKIDLHVPVPHMFIDGLRRNPFRVRSRDLWSLSKRLSSSDRINALEGDFYKFFDVYAADKDAIVALSVLTPDVMIQLRDSGYEFDYELYGSAVYVIGPGMVAGQTIGEVQGEVDAFRRAIKVCTDQLIPQIIGKTFPHTKTLRVMSAKEIVAGWVYSSLVIARVLGVVMLYFFASFIILLLLMLVA